MLHLSALLLLTLSPPPLRRRELLASTVSAIVPARASAASGGSREWQDPRWAELGLTGTAVHLRSVSAAAEADSIGQIGLYPDPLLRRTGSP